MSVQTNQQLPLRKNWLVIGAVVFILLSLIFVLYREMFAARVKITSVDSAKIFVSTTPGEDMKQIGTGKATFKSYGGGDELYILVQNGDQKTMTSAKLERRKTKEVSVELKALASPKQIADSSLAFPHKETDFIFGLNPITQSITYRPTGKKQSAGVSYLTLPRIFAVTWKDRKNFIFNSNSGGVKLFTNGKASSVGLSIEASDLVKVGANDRPGQSGAILIDPSKGGVSDLFFTDYTASKSVAQYFVMNSQGVYFAGDGLKTKKLKSVYSFEDSDQANQLFQDEQYTFVVSRSFAEHNEEEQPNPTNNLSGEGSIEDVDDPLDATIRIFKFDGSYKENLKLPITASITAVVSLGDDKGYGIQTDKGFYLYDSSTKQLVENPMYFDDVIDVMRDGSSIIMLNKEGLWQYQNSSLYLLAGPVEGNSFMPSSLAKSGKSIIFSSYVEFATLRSKGNKNASATYSIPVASN